MSQRGGGEGGIWGGWRARKGGSVLRCCLPPIFFSLHQHPHWIISQYLSHSICLGFSPTYLPNPHTITNKHTPPSPPSPLSSPTLSPRFFLLCFFNSFCVFWYSILTYLRNERWAKAFAEARNRNKGRLDFFMVGHHAEAAGASAASVAAADKAIPQGLPAAGAPTAAATAVTVAPPPPAAPKPKPGYFFGVLAENVTDQLDFLAFLVFSAAFLVGAALILAGPSNVTGLT